MSDNVNRPSHYRKGKVECIDAIKSALAEGYEYYLQGNILKYVWRYNHKNQLEDLEKALVHIILLVLIIMEIWLMKVAITNVEKHGLILLWKVIKLLH